MGMVEEGGSNFESEGDSLGKGLNLELIILFLKEETQASAYSPLLLVDQAKNLR